MHGLNAFDDHFNEISVIISFPEFGVESISSFGVGSIGNSFSADYNMQDKDWLLLWASTNESTLPSS